MKRIIFAICTILCANVLFAQTRFWIDDLQYEVTSTNPPKVKVYDAASSITIANIPATVTYNETIYSVTTIGKTAFFVCSSLTSVSIPNSVTTIEHEEWNSSIGAFTGCTSLTSVTFEEGINLTNIPPYTFCGCSLTSIDIPNSVTSIGIAAFNDCEYLTSVTLPENATIDTSAFYQSGYSTIDTVDNVVYCLSHDPLANIGNYTFERVFNVTFTIGDSIYAPNCATVWSHTPELSGDLVLTSYVYNGVSYPITSIDHGAFMDCSGLTSVTIPNSVNNIRNNAFYGCSSLTSVTCFASIPPILEEEDYPARPPFYNTPTDKILNVGCGLRDDYAIVWTDFAPNNIYEIPFNVTVTANNDLFGSVTIVSECPTATLTATANDCYEFISWSDGNTDNPRTINLESDTALTAIFNGILNSSITATICQGEVYQEQGFNASEAGIYTQILEASNGCDSVVMLTLNVNPAFDTTINATINIGDVYSEYGFNETEDGTYVQNLQTINGCDSTITLNLTINTSLQDIAELTEITFHPNPTSRMITFSKEIERIDVIDNIGKVVMRFFDTNEINIETLPAGVYYLRLTIEDKTTMKKVIKE